MKRSIRLTFIIQNISFVIKVMIELKKIMIKP